MADDLYKRSEDRDWRTKVDHEIVTLITSQKVTADRLSDMEETLEELDTAIRGDLGKNTEGLVERIDDMERGLASLRALMAPDALGHGGIINRLSSLEIKDRRLDRRAGRRWQFWTAVTVAAITSGIIGKYADTLTIMAERLFGGRPSATSSAKSSRKSGPRRARHPAPAVPKPVHDEPAPDALPGMQTGDDPAGR